MNKLILLSILCCIRLNAFADSIDIKINSSQLLRGESLQFECTYPTYLNRPKSILTLHVWIEELGGRKTWKFRYPVAGGKAYGAIKIDSSMKEGGYAFHFLVQKSTLSLNGTINNFIKKDSIINMILSTGKEIITDDIKTDEFGNFKINKYLFEDTVNFIFTPRQKRKGNNDVLNISLITPLDSSFSNEVQKTMVITIGNNVVPLPTNSELLIDPIKFNKDFTLPEFITYGNTKSKEEAFNEKYSSDLFKREDEKIISGFENYTLMGYPTVLEYLNDRIPGLKILQSNVKPSKNMFSVGEERTNNTESDRIYWSFAYRSSNEVSLFIDEHLVDTEQFISFPLSDIAIIKIIPPPFIGAWGSNPFAILIYSNRREFKSPSNKHSFTVNGYTPAQWIIKY